jgi:NAD-dependent DNA ligase
LKTLSIKQIVDVLEAADDAFFNTSITLLSDDIYDIVKDYLRKKDPKNAYLKKVGAQVEFNKEKLPYYLGSLDKIRDNESEIIKWKKKYPGEYIISEKLDGISCLIDIDKGTTHMYTRGDGFEGQNVTHILPYINMPNIKHEKIAVRGELIISKKNWATISDVGSNPRNVVAGAIHSKTMNKIILSKIDFIAYDVLYPRMKLGDSLNLLDHSVKHMVLQEKDFNFDTLSKTLQDWRSTSIYDIDGIVIQHNAVHNLISGQNPKYAFAFKTIMTHEQVEVIVTDVEWNVSKHRYLKPIVKFNEVHLGGVKIKQATGFNAAFIEKNKIGPGSRVVIVRSGDVIPHIISVLSLSASGIPKMPDDTYVWNDSHVDILLAGSEKNKEQDIQIFTHFMKTFDISGVKEGTLKKMYDTGYDSLNKIIHMSVEDLLKIDGFKEKSAGNVYEALQNLKNVSCDKLMVASNVFGRGFGDKKLQLIIAEYPYIAVDKKRALQLGVQDIKKIKGIADISAKQFIEGLPKFYEFYESLGIKCSNVSTDAGTTSNKKLKDIFEGKKVVFTGFRNKDYEKIIQQNGGIIMSSISSNTHYLIVKDANYDGNKIEKAKELNVKIMTKDELEEMIGK